MRLSFRMLHLSPGIRSKFCRFGLRFALHLTTGFRINPLPVCYADPRELVRILHEVSRDACVRRWTSRNSEPWPTNWRF